VKLVLGLRLPPPRELQSTQAAPSRWLARRALLDALVRCVKPSSRYAGSSSRARGVEAEACCNAVEVPERGEVSLPRVLQPSGASLGMPATPCWSAFASLRRCSSQLTEPLLLGWGDREEHRWACLSAARDQGAQRSDSMCNLDPQDSLRRLPPTRSTTRPSEPPPLRALLGETASWESKAAVRKELRT